MNGATLNLVLAAGILGGVVYLVTKGGRVAQAVNPVNPNNVVNQGFTSVVNTIAGNPSSELTPGDRLFRLFNPTEARKLCESGVRKFCLEVNPAITDNTLR